MIHHSCQDNIITLYKMSFKVTHKYIDSVLNDENVVGFMADVFPNKLIRDQVFRNIMNCVEPAGRHIFVHMGFHGKTTFFNLLNKIFGDNKSFKTFNEITKRDLIIAKCIYPIIFIACSEIDDDFGDNFEGDEWAYTTVVPHTELFEDTESPQEHFDEWIAPYIAAAKKSEENDKINMDKLIKTAKNIGMCMCDSESDCSSDSDSDE